MGFKFWKKKESKPEEPPQVPVVAIPEGTKPRSNTSSPIDLERETIIEMDAYVKSPPYAGPEKVTVSFDGSLQEGTVEYSGLIVDGWQDPDHGAVQMHPPGKRTVTVTQWNGIIEALCKDSLWYAPVPPGGEGLYGTRLYLSLTLVIKSSSIGLARSVVVGSNYFTGGKIPDEFLNVMKLVAATYPDRNILDIAHYD
jgi:hypothetical protein